MYSLVRGGGVGDCRGGAALDGAWLARLRRADGPETSAPIPPRAATMPVAAIDASINTRPTKALRRGRGLSFADDFAPALADRLLADLFLDIGLLFRPNRANRSTHLHGLDQGAAADG